MAGPIDTLSMNLPLRTPRHSELRSARAAAKRWIITIIELTNKGAVTRIYGPFHEKSKARAWARQHFYGAAVSIDTMFDYGAFDAEVSNYRRRRRERLEYHRIMREDRDKH